MVLSHGRKEITLTEVEVGRLLAAGLIEPCCDAGCTSEFHLSQDFLDRHDEDDIWEIVQRVMG